MNRKPTITLAAFFMLAAASLMFHGKAAEAQTLTTLYPFAGGSDGGFPAGGLILDAHGNLYGTAEGFQSDGTVFELTPVSGGGWTLTTLYTFQGGSDGAAPVANLVFDGNGNLFGTTTAGGGGSCSQGCGTVFELSPNGSGGWTKTGLYQFQGGSDGSDPNAALVFDSAGNLYSTTNLGGGNCSASSLGCGTVFQLSPLAGGGWSESILHRFGRGNDGSLPEGGLIFDASGNLYGTTFSGGIVNSACSSGCGIVFALSPAAGGGWTEKGLRAFTGAGDGAHPGAGLIFDNMGKLDGTTELGGSFNLGVVYRLVASSGGPWVEHVLHNFKGAPDGGAPSSALVSDAGGNLYGTTPIGGTKSCACGTLYRLTPSTTGLWTPTLLHSFSGGNDGRDPNPNGPLVLDGSGNLYGVTNQGGSAFRGTVFELTP
ncbi:MAG: choice-of-anchor tandem repeat GloVer-containing protein [Candidatus Sulfotelmatobacter sp.]